MFTALSIGLYLGYLAKKYEVPTFLKDVATDFIKTHKKDV